MKSPGYQFDAHLSTTLQQCLNRFRPADIDRDTPLLPPEGNLPDDPVLKEWKIKTESAIWRCKMGLQSKFVAHLLRIANENSTFEGDYKDEHTDFIIMQVEDCFGEWFEKAAAESHTSIGNFFSKYEMYPSKNLEDSKILEEMQTLNVLKLRGEDGQITLFTDKTSFIKALTSKFETKFVFEAVTETRSAITNVGVTLDNAA